MKTIIRHQLERLVGVLQIREMVRGKEWDIVSERLSTSLIGKLKLESSSDSLKGLGIKDDPRFVLYYPKLKSTEPELIPLAGTSVSALEGVPDVEQFLRQLRAGDDPLPMQRAYTLLCEHWHSHVKVHLLLISQILNQVHGWGITKSSQVYMAEATDPSVGQFRVIAIDRRRVYLGPPRSNMVNACDEAWKDVESTGGERVYSPAVSLP